MAIHDFAKCIQPRLRKANTTDPNVVETEMLKEPPNAPDQAKENIANAS